MRCFITVTALIGVVHAGLRFGCSTLSIQRLDPVVQPGVIPSSHVHHIVGGNAFNATILGDLGARGTCTTCQMSEQLVDCRYVLQAPDERILPSVSIRNNAALAADTVGGITISYTPYTLTEDNLQNQYITAFQPGFRMTNVGLRYNCLKTTIDRGPELVDFPTEPCEGDEYSQKYYDSCWDGVNLDSPDHKSHMYNTMTEGGFAPVGPCPASHPVRMPQVTYETVWDTTQFNSMWPAGAPNPFVWSFMGTSGYGTHAGYIFGWKGDALQHAMNQSECFYDGCGSITKQAMELANECTVPDFVGEDTEGWLTELPGNPM
ncbi:hypothetical protein F5Y16DRAFT_412221 [Xylariaceae sp. FL0255]|nr:hypothetical protein F5Y16DRAFT_412221 [Xylariaceae sp. FL0255]